MNYWLLYKKDTGVIYESPYLGNADKWTNIPTGCNALGPISKTNESASEAFEHPNYYTIQNNTLTPVPNIDELRSAERVPKPVPVSELDEMKQQIADINLALADMMGA